MLRRHRPETLIVYAHGLGGCQLLKRPGVIELGKDVVLLKHVISRA